MILGHRAHRLLEAGRSGGGHGKKLGQKLAGEEERGGRTSAVQFVAHMKRALHQGLQGDAAGPPDSLADQWSDHLLD